MSAVQLDILVNNRSQPHSGYLEAIAVRIAGRT